MVTKHNNFTDAKKIPLEKYKNFMEVENLISSTKDEDLLDDVYRMLAYLMQKIVVKNKKIWGVRKISPMILYKKFGFYKKGQEGWHWHYIFDHAYGEKWKMKDGSTKEILWTEPYGISRKNMKKLIEFCDEHNLDCWVAKTSEHFPNETTKIGICKSEQKFKKGNI